MAEFLTLWIHVCELDAVSPVRVGKGEAGALVLDSSLWNWEKTRRRQGRERGYWRLKRLL